MSYRVLRECSWHAHLITRTNQLSLFFSTTVYVSFSLSFNPITMYRNCLHYCISLLIEQFQLIISMFDVFWQQINPHFTFSHRTPFAFTPQEQKLKFYKLMIELDQHEGAYLDICKHYRAVYDTPLIQKEDARWKEVNRTRSKEFKGITILNPEMHGPTCYQCL